MHRQVHNDKAAQTTITDKFTDNKSNTTHMHTQIANSHSTPNKNDCTTY